MDVHQLVSKCARVVAKKIVSRLRFSLSGHHFLQKTWNKILSLIFHNTLNAGLFKLCVYKMVDAIHGKRTH